jgi:hypothetical protein
VIEHALIELRNGAYHIQLSSEAKQGPSIVALIDSLVPHYLRPNPLADPTVAQQVAARTVVAAADAPPPIPAFPPSIYEGVNNSLSSATSTTNLVVSSPLQYHVPLHHRHDTLLTTTLPFDPKAQKYHRGVSRLPSSRAPGGTSLTSPSAASLIVSFCSSPIRPQPPLAAAPAQDPRPPLPIRSSSLGILRSVMPRPRIDPAASVAAAAAASRRHFAVIAEQRQRLGVVDDVDRHVRHSSVAESAPVRRRRRSRSAPRCPPIAIS